MLTKQTIATKLRDTILNECPGCFSLYAGYGMKAGEYVRFPQGAQLLDKRNAEGRCIRAAYQYADGSTLTYNYHPKNECFTLTAN